VNGLYSSSRLWLYKWNILSGLVIFAGLILLGAFGIRRIKSKLKKELPFSGVLWGLGNSLVALAAGWFGFYLLEHLPRFFSYPMRDTVGIIIAFALVILGFLLLLGFPVYLSLQRNDWRIGLMVFATTIFGLLVGGMILVVTMQWV
jgi:Na+-transporting NADH:ubiquinone oxidoreductase subunit NqrD